jgi:hypothetical protein
MCMAEELGRGMFWLRVKWFARRLVSGAALLAALLGLYSFAGPALTLTTRFTLPAPPVRLLPGEMLLVVAVAGAVVVWLNT